ncbi:endonuclease/exonuclease/phosphatase family protein [Rhodovulum sp. DZ06]|uniref:endonuclease/exonuclease/phosphatase family protein n=1 Tax=Rhodovulum sp. DZ06 TaxID=3425126 RepID=UPI003D32F997
MRRLRRLLCALALAPWAASSAASAQELAAAAPPPPEAGAIRVAVFNASLSRRGPGLAWKALAEGRQDQVHAVADIIRLVRPDVIAVLELDHDREGLALSALQALLARDGGAPGIAYPHVFAPEVNTGAPSGLDLDGDGEAAGPGDAWGWGAFPGQYGFAILSRLPLATETARSFARLEWEAMPGALIPRDFYGENAGAVRLSSKTHLDIAAALPGGGALHLLVSHPTPPVFDGPEDRNGRRNHDEIRFWAEYIDGADWIEDDRGGRGGLAPGARFVVLGDLNADPEDGDGRHEGIGGLLAHPRVQDPAPTSPGARAAASEQGGANARQAGDPARDTADWRDAGGPGNLRVDYALPSDGLAIAGSGVFWPAPDAPGAGLVWGGGRRPPSSDHRLVWVDIRP